MSALNPSSLVPAAGAAGSLAHGEDLRVLVAVPAPLLAELGLLPVLAVAHATSLGADGQDLRLVAVLRVLRAVPRLLVVALAQEARPRAQVDELLVLLAQVPELLANLGLLVPTGDVFGKKILAGA